MLHPAPPVRRSCCFRVSLRPDSGQISLLLLHSLHSPGVGRVHRRYNALRRHPVPSRRSSSPRLFSLIATFPADTFTRESQCLSRAAFAPSSCAQGIFRSRRWHSSAWFIHSFLRLGFCTSQSLTRSTFGRCSWFSHLPVPMRPASLHHVPRRPLCRSSFVGRMVGRLCHAGATVRRAGFPRGSPERDSSPHLFARAPPASSSVNELC